MCANALCWFWMQSRLIKRKMAKELFSHQVRSYDRSTAIGACVSTGSSDAQPAGEIARSNDVNVNKSDDGDSGKYLVAVLFTHVFGRT